MLLDPVVAKIRNVRADNPKRYPKKPCAYVGLTGLTPQERFANQKREPKPDKSGCLGDRSEDQRRLYDYGLPESDCGRIKTEA